MRVRGLDVHHDWTFGRGRKDYLTSSEAIAQNVKTRLLSFQGDWFLDETHGLPWLEMMEKGDIEDEMIVQVITTEGVDRITDISLSFDPNTRNTKVNLHYIDMFGTEQGLSEAILLS